MDNTTIARTHVYVDGFNLYYGLRRFNKVSWLDINTLCRKMLATYNKIKRIKYFTARVNAWPDDLDKPQRQETYLRALRTIPYLEVYFGHFLSHPKKMPYVTPPSPKERFAWVIKTEEKGSDVNLASHLILDAVDNEYDTAVIISNDSDLLFPIQQVRAKFHKRVGIINPHSTQSVQLKSNCDFLRDIRKKDLLTSQFPHSLTDSRGTFTIPTKWK